MRVFAALPTPFSSWRRPARSTTPIVVAPTGLARRACSGPRRVRLLDSGCQRPASRSAQLRRADKTRAAVILRWSWWCENRELSLCPSKQRHWALAPDVGSTPRVHHQCSCPRAHALAEAERAASGTVDHSPRSTPLFESAGLSMTGAGVITASGDHGDSCIRPLLAPYVL